MSEKEIEIDLMELADIGQPTKIALEIHRQLRIQFGTVPPRVPLAGIAKAVGIVGIQFVEGVSFDGTLVVGSEGGAIGIRKGMRTGRENFTLGHEIGHFLIPTHRRRDRFVCEPRDMARTRAGNFDQRPQEERIEVEANEFSAALLVPVPEYRDERKRLGTACDVSHVRTLAETFDVSQEVMAKLYVTSSDEKVAIVTSHNGIVRRVIPQQGFPFLGLRKDVPLPTNALARTFAVKGANDPISNLAEVETHTWLDKPGAVSAMYEQVFLQEDGWAMTLLMIDEEQVDEEDDDRNWNRRSGRH